MKWSVVRSPWSVGGWRGHVLDADWAVKHGSGGGAEGRRQSAAAAVSAQGTGGRFGQTRGTRGRGFSLLELLTVMAIIAVIAVIAVPAIAALTKDNSRAQAGQQVRAMLSEARSLALAQHRAVGVVFFEETGTYSMPVHGGQTAMQIFVEDFEQEGYNPAAGNTVFVAYSPARAYLPAGVRVAALNDDASRGVTTGDEASSTTGQTRAVLFDAAGRMITRHGLARPDLGAASPGALPWAMGDWSFTTKRGAAHLGVSSPGILLYDGAALAAAGIATDHAGDAARNAWLKGHATVVIVNANTGALLP